MRTQISVAGIGASQVVEVPEGGTFRVFARLEDYVGTAVLKASFPAANAWDLRVYDEDVLVHELLYQSDSAIAASLNTAWNVDGIGFVFTHTFTPTVFPLVHGKRYRLVYTFHASGASGGDIIWAFWVTPKGPLAD